MHGQLAVHNVPHGDWTKNLHTSFAFKIDAVLTDDNEISWSGNFMTCVYRVRDGPFFKALAAPSWCHQLILKFASARFLPSQSLLWWAIVWKACWNMPKSLAYQKHFTWTPFKRCLSDRMLWAVVISQCGLWWSPSPALSVLSTSPYFRYLLLVVR